MKKNMLNAVNPRILLISQWPNVKNGEYELIEKIKRTGYEIKVVDFFGFDVETGKCLNVANLQQEFDFAISFHYDTPKFLNIHTFLWVANPLEFMHLRGDYRSVLLHQLRSYDDYLYNGSELLKEHIKNVVGSEWIDTGLEMFPSCSLHELVPPKSTKKQDDEFSNKLFYCGVNWERGIDKAGRSQGLLDILQEKQIAEFYGPNNLEGINPWQGFSSYRGEIPFDGVSMMQVMRKYAAILAVSSPAHIKSKTSSSRVFEGVAAGVPVISDENPHVKHLFGDLVYYFKGDTEEERAQSILNALQEIIENPMAAHDKVARAQALMADRFCFEPCFDRIRASLKDNSHVSASSLVVKKKIDVFLLEHDANSIASEDALNFLNLPYVVEAANHVAKLHNVCVRIIACGENIKQISNLHSDVSLDEIQPLMLTDQDWGRLRLGEKVAILAEKSEGDFATFLTQFDYVTYDAFSKAMDWFERKVSQSQDGLYVGGFFVNDLEHKAPQGTVGILRNNISQGLYRWRQNSLAEHQFGSLFFSKGALRVLEHAKINRLDVLLPISIIVACLKDDLSVHRARHLTLRVQHGHFHRSYEANRRAAEKGFWAQHYDLVTNYNHELNALYDVHHESFLAREILDQISGYALPAQPPVDPAIHRVNGFITRLRPFYKAYTKVARFLKIK